MKTVKGLSLIGSIVIFGALAQHLTKGVSVQMAVAAHGVEMPGADEPNATVVAITAGGKVFTGIQVTGPEALSNLSAQTIYVKADARAPYQTVLSVLEALQGKTVILLTAPPPNAAPRQGVVPPYGIRLKVIP